MQNEFCQSLNFQCPEHEHPFPDVFIVVGGLQSLRDTLPISTDSRLLSRSDRRPKNKQLK